MNMNELKKLVNELTNEHEVNLPIVFRNTLRAHGSVHAIGGKPVQMSFSRHLTRMSDDDIRDTILHEIAHALDYKQRGKSGHDEAWKAICRKIGAKPSRSSENGFPRDLFKYEIKCTNCGQVVAYRQVASKRTIERIARSRHTECGDKGTLEIVKRNIIPEAKVNVEERKIDVEFTNETFTAVELAKSIHMCPKKLRKKLRDSAAYDLALNPRKWIFPIEKLADVKKVLNYA